MEVIAFLYNIKVAKKVILIQRMTEKLVGLDVIVDVFGVMCTDERCI